MADLIVPVEEGVPKTPPDAVQIISIDGNIGAGKSTFLDHLTEFYKDDPTVVILK